MRPSRALSWRFPPIAPRHAHFRCSSQSTPPGFTPRAQAPLTKRRNTSSSDAPSLPALPRNSASVPSAKSLPVAMMPMRSAIRSATSRICVVKIIDSARAWRVAAADPSPVARWRRRARSAAHRASAIGDRGSELPAKAVFCFMPREKPSHLLIAVDPTDSKKLQQLLGARDPPSSHRRPKALRRIRDIPTPSACHRASAHQAATPSRCLARNSDRRARRFRTRAPIPRRA